MKNSKDLRILKHIVQYCQRIASTVELYDIDEKKLCEDFVLQDAVSMQLAQIGELARILSDEFKEKHSEIPWAGIVRLRNLLVHDYQNTDFAIVWETIRNDIPSLEGYCSTCIISADPKMREKIIEGLHTPLEECVPEDEVQW